MKPRSPTGFYPLDGTPNLAKINGLRVTVGKKSALKFLTDCVSPGVFLNDLVNSEILPDASSLLKPVVVREALFSLLLVVSTLIKRL